MAPSVTRLHGTDGVWWELSASAGHVAPLEPGTAPGQVPPESIQRKHSPDRGGGTVSGVSGDAGALSGLCVSP